MFIYPLLEVGDRLPAVAVLQKLLNRAGANLAVDGIYLNQTQAAVFAFQSKRRIPPLGKVDQATWSKLVLGDELPVIDCIDVFDPEVFRWDASPLIAAGGHPILVGGMSNGVVPAIKLVASEAAGQGNKLFLLRFDGHGSPGWQGVSGGAGTWREWRHGRTVLQREQLMSNDPSLTDDQLYSQDKYVVANGERWYRQRHKMPTHAWTSPRGKSMQIRDQMTALSPVVATALSSSTIWEAFGPYGCVQLHGCNVGSGAKGRQLLRKLAEALQVPVSAAAAGGKRGQQPMGESMRFSGPVLTAFPHDDAQRWYRSLPDFPPLSTG